MKALLTSFINRNKTHRKHGHSRVHTNHARGIDANEIEGRFDNNATT